MSPSHDGTHSGSSFHRGWQTHLVLIFPYSNAFSKNWEFVNVTKNDAGLPHEAVVNGLKDDRENVIEFVTAEHRKTQPRDD